MGLTTGRGPLGPDPAGTFSAPLPPGVVYVEPHRRRVRARVGDRTVVDTERALLVHRPGRPPSFALPAGDVRVDGAAPVPEAPGHVHVPWDAVDTWLEEDEPITFHPRSPYHRVDCLRTSRRLRVEVAGVTLVDTTATLGVFETALAPRLYVAPDQVLPGTLVPSPTRTYCPYKGTASYWTAVVGDEEVPDLAWSYEDPLPESLPLRGLLGFDGTKATVVEDLAPEPGPTGSGQSLPRD